ncbi:hypothetical protein JCM10207_005272 [Rhodosporidiobolus poonsookiae]
MDAPDSPQLAIVTRLLRVVSLLSGQLDPSTGLKASAAALVVDKLKEVVEQHERSMPQDDDLRLRQNTNVALASTCRAFHAAVQSILRREIHLFTPGQVLRVHAAFRQESSRALGVRSMTLDLGLDQLHRQRDGTWAGRHIGSIIRRFVSLEALRIRFGSDHQSNSSLPPELYFRVESALGFSEDEWVESYWTWRDHPKLFHIDVPLLSSALYNTLPIDDIFRPPANLRHLRIGDSSVPLATQVVMSHRDEWPPEEEEEDAPFRWESFCAPFVTFNGSTLLRLVGQVPPNPTPSIRRLEITFYAEDLRDDLDSLGRALTGAIPTLKHLSLRLRTRSLAGRNETYAVCTQTLLPFFRASKLRHLEIGGNIVCLEFVATSIYPLPSLHPLTVLPMDDTPFDLIDLMYHLTRTIRPLVLCTPAWRDDNIFHDQAWVRMALETSEKLGIELIIEERPAEFAWLHNETLP